MLDNTGNLIISDRLNHRIIRYSFGSNEGEVIAGGQRGHNLQDLDQPHGIAMAADGDVIIADTFNDRVVRWTPGHLEGRVVAGNNGPGSDLNQLNHPMGVVVDKNSS